MSSNKANVSLPSLGLQPIIFNNAYDFTDPARLDAFLGLVASIGFEYVELSPPDAVVFNELSAKHNVKLAGMHTQISRNIDPEPIIRTMTATGARDVCNSALLHWGPVTADDYLEAIPILNKMGAALAREGIRYHYHNHAFEFEKVDGDRSGMDLLMEGLGPSVVDFAMDVAWIYRGGQDPADYLRRHQNRVGYIHLKDTDGESPAESAGVPLSPSWKELGNGRLDFDSIIATIKDMPHVAYAIVEQDKTDKDPAESCRISREFLRSRYGY